jgi:glucose-6-phosphate 1-dehydrogenase
LGKALQKASHVSGDVNNADAYGQMRELLDQIDKDRGTQGNRVFYLSTSPSLYAEAIQQLGAARLAKPEGKGWTRIIIEKPFGHDLASARDLNVEAAKVFDEDQVYRIDHYLGETVQNLMVFGSPTAFQAVWNRRDHVQIAMQSDRGRGPRRFYDTAGVLRDMSRTTFSGLSLVAIDLDDLGANAVRDER